MEVYTLPSLAAKESQETRFKCRREKREQRRKEEAFTLSWMVDKLMRRRRASSSVARRGWSTRYTTTRWRRTDSSAARRRRSLFCRLEDGRRSGASPRAGGERTAAQRGEDVHSSSDQRLVDAVHLHAQEESEQ